MTTERWIRQSVLVLVTVFSYDLKLLGGGGHKLWYYISSSQHARNVSENKRWNILRKPKVQIKNIIRLFVISEENSYRNVRL